MIHEGVVFQLIGVAFLQKGLLKDNTERTPHLQRVILPLVNEQPLFYRFLINQIDELLVLIYSFLNALLVDWVLDENTYINYKAHH